MLYSKTRFISLFVRMFRKRDNLPSDVNKRNEVHKITGLYVCLIFFLSHCKLLLDLCYGNVCNVYANKILILLYTNVTLVKLISRELFLYHTLGFNHPSPQVASFYVYQRLTTL